VVSQDEAPDAQAVCWSAVSGTAFPQLHQQSIEVQREDARMMISLLVIGAFVFIIVAAFALFSWRAPNPTADDIIKFCQALIGPVAGIVGAVTGFYFGASQAHRSMPVAGS
jgi:hypothetical protein